MSDESTVLPSNASLDNTMGQPSIPRSRPTSSESRPRKKAKSTSHNNNKAVSSKTKANAAVMECGDDHPLLFWDCSGKKDVPVVSSIKKLHIYDFDNTLFRSPHPNPALFSESTLGLLTNANMLACGSWWENPLVLKNVGKGWNEEKETQWESYWNEDIVELANMSSQDDEVLSIVMTGRKRGSFADLLKEMLEVKGIAYDGLMLKQGHFESTLLFKTQVLVDLLNFYTDIDEVVIYDDRVSQLNGFQKCLNEYIEAMKPEMLYNLVPVSCQPLFLDPKTERQLVEEMVERHNQLIAKGRHSLNHPKSLIMKKSVHYSAYMLDIDSRAHLINYLVNNYKDVFTDEVLSVFKFQAEFIPISKGQLAKNVNTLLYGNPVIDWVVTELGVSDSYIAVNVETKDPDIPTKTLTIPARIGVAKRGKSTTAPPEDFFNIDSWRRVETPLELRTEVYQQVAFKIVGEAEKRQKARNDK